MSSFIVEMKTINQIVNYLNKDMLLFQDSDNDGLDKLGRKLIDMNQKAVNYRCNDGKLTKTDKLYSKSYNYTFSDTNSDIIKKTETYKAIQCFLYQCTEGNIPDTKLYKIIKKAENLLAYLVISESVAYKEANWK